MTDNYYHRFGGIQRLYGVDGLECLKQAHVSVIGLGGVGSWAVEALARSGIERLTLVDLDEVCVTNVNRQLHATMETVGQTKVEAMADRARAINPAIDVNPVFDFLTTQNVATLMSKDFDYVIDAIDSVVVKAALVHYCKRNKIPLITTGGAGGKTDPTQIQVADLSRTYNDPLAAKVRSILRRQYGYSKNPKRFFSVPCVFSRQQLVYPQADGSVCQQKNADTPGPLRLDCSGGFGAATMVTASFGFVAVSTMIDKMLARRSRRPDASPFDIDG